MTRRSGRGGKKKSKLFKKKEKYKIRFKHFYPVPNPVFHQVSKLKLVLLCRKGFFDGLNTNYFAKSSNTFLRRISDLSRI